MSNEPNDAEKKLAREIAIALIDADHSINTDVDVIDYDWYADIIAPILAAHRAESESELAKVAEDVAIALEFGALTKGVMGDMAKQLRAALAAHDAGKEN